MTTLLHEEQNKVWESVYLRQEKYEIKTTRESFDSPLMDYMMQRNGFYLEFGCGVSQQLLKIINLEGFTFCAIDSSQKAIDILNKKIYQASVWDNFNNKTDIEYASKVTTIVGEFPTAIPIPEYKYYDYIVFSHILEFISRRILIKAFKTIVPQLRKNCRIYLLVYNKKHKLNIKHENEEIKNNWYKTLFDFKLVDKLFPPDLFYYSYKSEVHKINKDEKVFDFYELILCKR